MINPSEAALQNALQTNIKKAEALLHADFSRESGLIEKNGALRYLQQLLRRGQESPGFSQLSKCGKLALSAEAVVVRPEFGPLFTDDEVNVCFERLCENGYFSK